MGLGGAFKVVGISLGKAFRDLGITVGTVAATAGLIALQNPEVLAPVAAAMPPVGAALWLITMPILAKAGVDALKHADKAKEEDNEGQ